MSKSFHSNQPLKLLSASVCLIALIICNACTFQLAKDRLTTTDDASRQDFSRDLAKPNNLMESNANSSVNPGTGAMQPGEMPDNDHPEMSDNTSTPDSTQPLDPGTNRPDQQDPMGEIPEKSTEPFTNKTKISRIPYLAGLVVQSLCIALIIIYLTMSHLGQKSLREIFVNFDKITIFILGTLLLALSTSAFEIVIL